MDTRGRIRTTAFQSIDGVRIKGASWFGLESAACYIGGGDKASISSSAEFLRSNGFNAVRIPLAASEVLRSARGEASECMDVDVYYISNRAYLPLRSYLDAVGAWIAELAAHGLLVLLDVHVESPGKWPDEVT